MNKFTRIVSVLLLCTFFIGFPVQDTFASDDPSAQDEIAATIIHVPGDFSSIQEAIKQVPDGGIIEIASGTYENGNKAFSISNTGKGFTIRAAPGASVTLTGSNTHDVFRYLNSNRGNGKMVYFVGLTFANGYSSTDGVVGGMIVRYAEATFINCVFRDNNGNQPTTGGGGIVIADQSLAYFTNTKFLNNRAKFYAGGLGVAEGSQVTLVNAEFRNNRTNYPGHHSYSSGGGIHVGNSKLYVYGSHFEDNQAGYVGGAIYAAGIWKDPIQVPRTYVLIDDSTFINNHARKDPGVSQSSPTEAGAVHAEDQIHMIITNSTFTTNTADTGGGVNTYRGNVEIYNSVFLGNQAVGPGAARAFGGAVSAISSDGSGNINYPSARLSLKNVYIQGRYGSVTTVGLAAGGIYATGDTNRQYGISVPKMGTLSENRAKVSLENVILVDLDVTTTPDNQNGTGIGGALVTDLSDININGLLVIKSDAFGDTGQGGGLMFLNQSLANLTDVTIAKNTAQLYGGGFFAQGSEIHVKQSRFFENEISPGINESSNQSYGAAIFVAPDDGRGLWAIGEVRDSIISNNIGLPVFDDDRNNYPINETRYNSNQFYNSTFWDLVYANPINGSYWSNAAQLNNLIVSRSNGTNTDKAVTANSQKTSAIVVGDIMAVPPVAYTVYGSPTFYLAYAWSGGSATLNGSGVNGNAGFTSTSNSGTYTLNVSGTTYQVKVQTIQPNLFIPIVLKK